MPRFRLPPEVLASLEKEAGQLVSSAPGNPKQMQMFKNLEEYLTKGTPRELPPRPASIESELLKRQHPAMAQDIADLKAGLPPSERLKKASELGEVDQEKLGKLLLQREMEKKKNLIPKEVSEADTAIIDSKKAAGLAGAGLVGLGALNSNDAEASEKRLKNPYEGFDKSSLFYKDVPERYKQEESLESPSIDPLDLAPTPKIDKFGKLLKYLK